MPLLVDLAIKATVVFAASGVLALALRRSPAATRSLIWAIALGAVLILPLATTIVPAWRVGFLPAITFDPATPSADLPWPAATAPAATTSPTQEEDRASAGAAAAAEIDDGSMFDGARHRAARHDAQKPSSGASALTPAGGPEMSAAVPAGLQRLPWPQIALIVWATGALVLLGQLGAALLRVAWLERRATVLENGRLHELLQNAAAESGVRTRVRLLESDRIAVPITWRFVRPRILVPAGMRQWQATAQRAVLAHELEHVRRLDSWLQLIGRAVVSLHWFNPLAWLALHRLRRDREQACDDAVLRLGVRPSDYARQLVELACNARGHAHPSAAISMAASTRLRGRVQAILDPSTGRTSPTRRTVVTVTIFTFVMLLPLAALQPAQPAGAATLAQPTLAEPALAAGQAAEPSIDDLVRMRIHGVSPDFIAGMADLFGDDLDVDTLVKLRIHGVTADYARGMRAAFGDLDLEHLVQARIHGLSTDYAADMSRIFGEDLAFDQLRKMRIHGIAADTVEGLTAALGRRPTVDEAVKMRIHGVNVDYAGGMRDTFGADLGIDELVAGRIHGITAEYAERMTGLLGEDLDFDTLKKMRIHGVAADWVQELHDDGYADLTAQDLIDIKIHGMERILRKRRGGQD